MWQSSNSYSRCIRNPVWLLPPTLVVWCHQLSLLLLVAGSLFCFVFIFLVVPSSFPLSFQPFDSFFYFSSCLFFVNDLVCWLAYALPSCSSRLALHGQIPSSSLSHPSKIAPCAEDISLANPLNTREHQNTVSSTLPTGKNRVVIYRSRLGLPKAIL